MNDQPNAPAPAFAWEEPPPSRQRSFKDIPDALRQRRGEWARIAEYPDRAQGGMLVSRIRGGVVRYWQPAGSFEAVCRPVDGVFVVYARYVGQGGA